MGLTPLEGLVMGTRAGDHDASIGYYIMRKEGQKPEAIESILNRKSGVLGITEKYTDRRDIEIAAAKGDERCRLAIAIEGYRLKKYLGAYYASIGRVDAIVFTAGVGERGPIIREKCLEGLENLGIVLDRKKNETSVTRNAETEITGTGSRVRIFVIPTDEELVMTEDTHALLEGTYDIHTKFSYSFQDSGYVNKSREMSLKAELAEKKGLAEIIARVP
jgi:acetate kinase